MSEDNQKALYSALLAVAALRCEWCELILHGSNNIEKARTDGLSWFHDDGDGERHICEAGDIWEDNADYIKGR